MNKKRLLLAIGSIAATVAPIASVVACGEKTPDGSDGTHTGGQKAASFKITKGTPTPFSQTISAKDAKLDKYENQIDGTLSIQIDGQDIGSEIFIITGIDKAANTLDIRNIFYHGHFSDHTNKLFLPSATAAPGTYDKITKVDLDIDSVQVGDVISTLKIGNDPALFLGYGKGNYIYDASRVTGSEVQLTDEQKAALTSKTSVDKIAKVTTSLDKDALFQLATAEAGKVVTLDQLGITAPTEIDGTNITATYSIPDTQTTTSLIHVIAHVVEGTKNNDVQFSVAPAFHRPS